MNNENIKSVADKWVDMTYKTLDLKRIPSIEIKDVFRESYAILSRYYNEALIPKEVARLLLEMDGFLYFASMISEKEFEDDPAFYQAVHSVAEALKTGFFSGTYECAYPKLKVTSAEGNIQILDLESGCIEDLT